MSRGAASLRSHQCRLPRPSSWKPGLLLSVASADVQAIDSVASYLQRMDGDGDLSARELTVPPQ